MAADWKKIDVVGDTQRSITEAMNKKAASDAALASMVITATTTQKKSAAQVKKEWQKENEAAAFASMEITATTRQTRSAAQVEKDYVAPKDFSTIKTIKEAVGWDSIKAIGAQLDIGGRSKLDETIKSGAPIVNSAEQQLLALAGGGYANSFSNIKAGNLLSAEAGDNLAKMLPTNLNTASTMINAGALTELPGLVMGGLSDLTSPVKNLFSGGLGQAGTFNPAGVTLAEEGNPAGGDYIKLVPTVFTSGTTVFGETVDIYDKTLNSPQNSVKSILSNVLSIANNSVLGSLKGVLQKAAGGSGMIGQGLNALNLTTAKGVLDSFKGSLLAGVPLTKDGMIKELYGAIGYDGKSLAFKDGIQGVGENMLNDIKKNIDGETGLLSLYKGTKKILDGDGDTASNLFKIVENFTGNTGFSKFIQRTEEFQIIANVSKALIDMGAIDELEKIIEKIDHKDRDKLIKEGMAGGLDSGDIDFIKFALKHSSGPKILASYPDAISRIVSSFSPRLDDAGNIPKDRYLELISCLDKISPDWDKAGKHMGEEAMNLEVFSKFNQQGKLAVIAGGNRKHIAALITAENYQGIFETLPNLQIRYPDYPIA